MEISDTGPNSQTAGPQLLASWHLAFIIYFLLLQTFAFVQTRHDQPRHELPAKIDKLFCKNGTHAGMARTGPNDLVYFTYDERINLDIDQ